MSSLSLKNIYKVYDGNVTAVRDFCMEIEDKEFIVFVGPSGCGKSTTLRMVAGLEDITEGELQIDGVRMNEVEPKDRDIAMVFQNYALYPHMTVYDNMAFALKLRKMPKAEIHERVMEAAKILDIEQYLDRKPKAMSGGQRQRVALGRAIVRQPKVFLLDEPLSNLDAKLRAAMRTEITKLHKKVGTTFIYVTHDQVEAMTMGTRIVVMKDGLVQQIDSPQNLYDHPANKFVAGFIGSPQMNFFDADVKAVGDKVQIDFEGRSIKVSKEAASSIPAEIIKNGGKVVMGIRPEDIHADEEYLAAAKDVQFDVTVDVYEALGAETVLYGATKETGLFDKANLAAKVDSRMQLKIGQNVTLALDENRLHFFDIETEINFTVK
ncbi:MAG: sn-glycerol-3-phosphate ABC transporter ATP-binding protein UgpC [Bacillota bacterium]